MDRHPDLGPEVLPGTTAVDINRVQPEQGVTSRDKAPRMLIRDIQEDICSKAPRRSVQQVRAGEAISRLPVLGIHPTPDRQLACSNNRVVRRRICLLKYRNMLPSLGP